MTPRNDNPRRTPQLQRFLDGMQETMGMDDEEARVLTEGSDHSYHCRCATCLDWWASIGPEFKDGKTPTYGPFTEQEIEDHKASRADLTS